MKLLYKIIIEAEDVLIDRLKIDLITDFLNNFTLRNIESETARIITLKFKGVTVDFYDEAIEITAEKEEIYKKAKEILLGKLTHMTVA